jgi:hypothetical protein
MKRVDNRVPILGIQGRYTDFDLKLNSFHASFDHQQNTPCKQNPSICHNLRICLYET